MNFTLESSLHRVNNEDLSSSINDRDDSDSDERESHSDQQTH